MVRFSKAVMQSTAKILRKNLKEGKGYLTRIKMKDMDGKTHKINKAHYMGLFEAQNVFIIKHGRYPHFVTLNSTANNPLVIDYQNTAYNCCPTSMSMASQMLFNYHTEQEFVKALGTVQGSGTDPSKLVSNAPKLGFKAERIARNFSSVKKSLSKGYPVVAHIQTKPAKCLGYTGDYGHYILIYAYTKDGYYKIADPTKGLKTCSPSILDKATNGRDIGYYSVKPK